MERSSKHWPLSCLAPLCTGILWLSIVGVSWAQREVTIQQGPLYRTVGSHITIWCQVRGYQGPSEQTFQYSIYLPSAPDREVQIVSTRDPSFSYAIFSQRVRNGDIYIERVTGDHTVLHIGQLQERDAGEYECHTPNTDPKFYGSYSAKVNLSVLPDTLLVTMSEQKLDRLEGGSLELTCQVSGNSSQHTHLAVSWFLTTDKDLHILSLSRDFVLVPGNSFSERFSSGDIRLDKLGNSSYRLSIKDLRLSDQGDVFCQGSEWIQDPDGTWTKIKEKKSQRTMVRISAKQGGDFEVQAETTNPHVELRSPLEITCTVSTHWLIGGRFHVTWLLNGVKMTTWDPSGISSLGTNYTARGATGQMYVIRKNQETWALRMGQTREQDGGSYLCDVMEERTQRRRQSSPVQVTIETPRSPPQSVALYSNVSEMYEGDSVRLFCQVSSVSQCMAVTWLSLRPSGHWVKVASLRCNGELEAAGEYVRRYESGHLTAQRLRDGLHCLTLDNVVEGDGGAYSCHLTELTLQRDETRRYETYDSNQILINVKRLGAGLEVVLMSRDQQVTSGTSASLFCKMSAGYSLQNKLLSWSWDFQLTSGSFQNLVTVSGDGGLSWKDSVPGFQSEAQISIVGHLNTLKIYRVQRHHQGAYRCRVEVRRRDASVPPASAYSITMSVNVQLPASHLLVDASHRDVLVTGGQDQALVHCNITAITPGTVHHVGWFLESPTSPTVNILNLTDMGLTFHHPSFPGFLSERVSPRTIILRILRPQLLGSFYCAVRELLQESGKWVTLAEHNSGITRLKLKPSDKTLKVLKVNVSCAVAAGGEVVLRCPLEEVRSSAALYSVSWYHQTSPVSYPSLLYRITWEGVTEYAGALEGRLQMVAAVRGNYSLILRSVGPEDAGSYHCRLEEWRLQEDGWRLEAVNTSGYLQIRVTGPDDRLSVNSTALTLVAPEDSSLALPCHVVSSSVSGSIFSITWWRVLLSGHRLLFNASHLGQIAYPSEEGGRLQYQRAEELTFQLRILRTHVADTGIYYCQVQEWVQGPRQGWYQIAQETGGNLSVTIQAAGISSPICSPPWLFFFLLLVLVIFLLLLLALGLRLLTRWKIMRTSKRPIRNGKGLWSSVKMSEMDTDQTEEKSKTEEAEAIQLQPTQSLSH
ncbi:immunoglobulin superfamily member 2-like isoform X2 [Dendropsophus ebraccatus]|uniref:immunoglobulin superfamily member 2-like isoform X2 n=1 Tax=Dendropsophus ebraccatus TaxID=150705 RepID=UPI003831FA36